MRKKTARNKSNRKNNNKKKDRKPIKSKSQYSNFVAEAGPGCFIAHYNRESEKLPDWMIGWEDIDPEEYGQCEVPDIGLDPEDFSISICNVHDYAKVAYVTIFETKIIGRNGLELEQGFTVDDTGQTIPCITFIVFCPPCVFAHLGFLKVSSEEDLLTVRIENDVSKWNQHPNPSDEHPFRIGFPLNCNSPTTGDHRLSFLCTQGEAGELTHFFSGNLHAIDFRCPIGTELLAVADGIITEAKDENTVTGISVTNLFKWNSIMLQIQNFDADSDDDKDNVGGDGPLFVEYVHISKSIVKAGERVKRGQVIGYSGSVGFSPEPHLHFSAFRSSDATAPTVRVLFENCTNRELPPFIPRAGKCYDSSGIVDDQQCLTNDSVNETGIQ